LKPEDLPMQVASREGREVRDASLTLQFKDGSTREIFGGAVPLFDDRGKPRGSIGAFVDITELKHAEAGMKEIAEKYSYLFDNTSDGVWIHDVNGKILDVNDAYCRMSGYKREEIIGMRIDKLEARESPIKAFPHNENLIKSGHGRFESLHRRKDGSLFNVDISALYIDKRGGQVAIFTRDITDRKKSEETLRETRDYLENLLNYANAPIIVWNPDFRITQFNHAFEHLTGYSSEEVTGQKLEFLFPEENRELSMDHIRKAVEGERWESVEIPIRHKGGHVSTVLWNSATLFDKGGNNAVATIAQGMDITDRKKAESKLLEQAQELEQFAYVVSHDLKEPLRKVTNYIDLLKMAIDQAEIKDIPHYMDVIGRGALRMSNLIDDLLTFARLSRPVQETEVPMNRIVRNVLGDLEIEIKERKAIIKTGKLPTIRGVPQQIHGLFQNLLTNALKFQKGQIPKIFIRASNKGKVWQITVEDNGIGIAPQFHRQIFGVFQRLHGRDVYPGAGIGLALCRKIVERHGGEIWVESELGKGSKFHFTFPK